MKVIHGVLYGLLELFIDDEFLAIGIIAVVAATAGLIFILGVSPLAAGVCLVVGNVAVLVVGAFRTIKRRPRL